MLRGVAPRPGPGGRDVGPIRARDVGGSASAGGHFLTLRQELESPTTLPPRRPLRPASGPEQHGADASVGVGGCPWAGARGRRIHGSIVPTRSGG